MWRLLKTAAVFAVTIAPPAAFADSRASSKLTIRGTAEEVCLMPPPRATGSANTSFDGENITIGDLIDDTTATVNAFTLQLTYAGVMCNTNAMVSLTSLSGGLKKTDGAVVSAASSGVMLSEIDYVATLTWGSVEAPALDTAQQAGSMRVETVTGGANLADMVLTITGLKGDTPVVLGDYEDTLIIHIEPNL